MSVLSAAALPARIRVFAPGGGGAQAGEVHLLAGGINDAFAGDRRGQEAVSALQQVAGARFMIDTRLPDPETGSLAKPGPGEGNLAQRPLVEIMRYCEEYVLTCTLEVWRGEEQARISYRRGELVGTTVGGSDAPERLPEVMGWKEGFFEIDLPLPVTPPAPAPSRHSTGMGAVGGAGVLARPPSEARPRRQTDPLISFADIKKSAPARPVDAPVRPTGESVPKLPRVPSLPGLKSRFAAPGGRLPTLAAGLRPAPSGPAPSPVGAPIRGASPSPAPTASAATPARTAQAPVVAQAKLAMPAAHRQSTAGISAEKGGTAVPPAPAASARAVAPAPPAVVAGPPVAGAPGTARPPQAPLPSALTPTARRPATTSPLVPVPWPTAKPSVAQPSARPMSAPLPEAAAAPPSLSQGSVAPPPAAPASPPASAPAAPVQRTTPFPATPPSSQAVSAAASVDSPPRLSEPAASPSPPEIRGASAAAAHTAPSPVDHTSGEIMRPSTPPRGTEERPFGVELSEDMQDPAAFVDTPPPQNQVIVASRAKSTPTPVSELPRPAEPPTVRIKGPASVQPEDLAVDIEDTRFRPDKRRARRGPADWPLLVHVLLGIVLGAAIVVAYSAYCGLPLPLP